jgi:hypothetical protein
MAPAFLFLPDPYAYEEKPAVHLRLVRAVESELEIELDVLACPRCGGRMRILAAINPPDAIQKILTCLGLPTRAPPIAPAISNPNPETAW